MKGKQKQQSIFEYGNFFIIKQLQRESETIPFFYNPNQIIKALNILSAFITQKISKTYP